MITPINCLQLYDLQSGVSVLGGYCAEDSQPIFEVEGESFDSEFREVGGKNIVDGPSE